jgi:hypothetical protein
MFLSMCLESSPTTICVIPTEVRSTQWRNLLLYLQSQAG